MKKAESLSAIVDLWMDLPESDRTTRYFHTFYRSVETDHPELLTWRLVGGWRDKEVKSHLLSKKLMTLG